MRARLPLLLAPLLSAGCSEPEPELPPHRIDLLARAPELIVDQPGKLEPDASHWSSFAYDGWIFDGEDRSVAWAEARTASLRLPSLGAEERQIELELQGPGKAGRVTIELNDHELGQVDVGPETSRHVLATRAGSWQRGDNVLSLQGSVEGTVAGKDVFFGLRRVTYAKDELSIEPSRTGYTVPAACSVVYRLELLAESSFHLRGLARGAGRLELRVREIDPISGEGPAPEERSYAAEDGELFVDLPLPRGEGVVELDLTWLSTDPASALEIQELGLDERPGAARVPVLFVSIDTLSAQHLSLHGYARKTTPNLEALAKDAVVFRNCRSNAPWTIPSYMSQFTGLYPRAHMIKASLGEGRLDATPWETQQMAPSRWTMAEFYRAAGYTTAAFVDNPWLTRGFGFQQGFEDYDGEAAEIGLEDPSGGLRNIVPRAMDWLDARRADEPFFLFLQAFDPHAPYHAAAPWKGRFDGDRMIDSAWEIPVGRQQNFAYGCVPGHIAYALCADRPLPERLAVAPIAAAYDEKIAEVDAALAELLAGLRARGLYDELLIVFSADHGESTINHDFYFNHAMLYGDVLHVPLLIKLPGQEHGGESVDSLVQLVDLYPTLFELVRPGVSRDVHGRSLLPLLRGGRSAERIAFAEGELMQQFSVEKDGWKLIVSRPLTGANQTQLTHPRLDREKLGEICPELAQGFFTNAEIAATYDRNPKARKFVKDSLTGPFYELYHLPDDPAELHDLAKEHPERVQELLAHAEKMQALGDAAKSQALFAVPPVELGSDALEEMKALGYVGE
jgi:arylsulfatase